MEQENKQFSKIRLGNYDKNVKYWLKKNILAFVFLFASIAITILNLSWLLFSPDLGSLNTIQVMSISLSYVASLFGMLNVTTYSLMDLKSKHRNKFKIFILFNLIAVISLGIVNITSHLWFLVFENIAFAFSGFFQYYKWFIKPEESFTNSDTYHGFQYKFIGKKNWKNIIFIVSSYILFGFIASIISLSITISTSSTIDFPLFSASAKDIIAAFVDGYAFVLSFSAAIMVGKRITESQMIYIIADILLIIWWVYQGVGAFQSSDTYFLLTSINLILLFMFYTTSNIINLINWTETKNSKSKFEKDQLVQQKIFLNILNDNFEKTFEIENQIQKIYEFDDFIKNLK